MENRLKGTNRTKSVALRRALTDGYWTPERVEARDNSREMLMNAVELSFRRPDDCRVLMFPDARDLFWGMLLDGSAERGARGRVIFHRHEPRAPRFPEWCVSGTTAVLAHGRQGTLPNSERFSARAVLPVGWLGHILRSSS